VGEPGCANLDSRLLNVIIAGLVLAQVVRLILLRIFRNCILLLKPT